MIEDLSKYSADRKKNVQTWFSTIGKEMGITRAVAEAAVFSGCPCLAVCCWIAEIDGWSEELIQSTKNIMKFYHYTEVLHAPEGFPL